MLVTPWEKPTNPAKFMKPGVVHIWQVKLHATKDELNFAKDLLSVDEIQNGQQLYYPELRQRHWLAHAWKRYILAQRRVSASLLSV